MSFNSLHFIIFFPLITAIYFSISHKYRWLILLLGSYYFYMSWRAEYIILILFSTLIDYVAGIQIFKSQSKIRKKIFLSLSLLANLSLLFTFKYFNFFSESTRAFLEQFSIHLNPLTLELLLPVGISFYTFQSLSYTIDVYRNKIKPEYHFGIFAVYVSFFPQLVAGPIERSKNLLPQFYKKINFDYRRVTDGLKLMLWGFFKKIVIADRLSVVVDNVFNNAYDYSGQAYIVATIFFAFQIYCDFSGYSDIAIGSSQVLGIKLMDNFKRPYFAKSISEFWQRWHISLSTWFRDYLYIPLGGNRVSIPRWYINLMIVFIVSGLWHGANWTFVAWGFLHGFYLIMEYSLKPLKNKLNLNINKKISIFSKWIFTMILVNIGWIFFRANNIQEAGYIINQIITNTSLKPLTHIGLGVNSYFIYTAIALIIFMEFIHHIQEHRKIRHMLNDKPMALRWSLYLIMIMSIILFGQYNNSEFIYFQF